MGRPKGGKNRTWTSKEKYEVILPIIKGEISQRDRAKECALSRGMIILKRFLLIKLTNLLMLH